MNSFIYRHATTKDVPFLVQTIIEAEKSGSDILSYSTIFGLSEDAARKYIAEMFLEEIDGCELSISSFLIAEHNGQPAASVGAWIEGIDGSPSNVLKGNLLNYILPKNCIEKAFSLSKILNESHIEYISNTIQIGVVYVTPEFRGMKLVSNLIEKQISRLTQYHSTVSEAYVQVFGNNQSAIRSYENSNFKIEQIKVSLNTEITKYLPSAEKILMKLDLITK